MEAGVYHAKRRLRLPLVWWGRWRHRNDPAPQRARLERNGYRRSAKRAADNVGFDRFHYYRADLDSSSVAVDVGAFTGEVAEKLRSLYDCEVHAYEPNPELFPQLEAQFAEDPRVHAHPYGLGSADATLSMQLIGLGSSVYGPDDPDVAVAEVQIRDVATVLDQLGVAQVDYLKLNIEGAEFDLLDRFLDAGWQHRTRYLLIQFHEWYPRAHLRRWQLRRRLRKTHDQVWCYPWIHELWCSKDQPHPAVPKFSRADKAEIRAAFEAARAEQAASDAG